jgi:hypothetical protein
MELQNTGHQGLDRGAVAVAHQVKKRSPAVARGHGVEVFFMNDARSANPFLARRRPIGHRPVEVTDEVFGHVQLRHKLLRFYFFLTTGQTGTTLVGTCAILRK